MLNPFDPKSVLFAKHAQHVVLIHFPIALYLSGTCFDLCARILRKARLADSAGWNFLAAAAMSLPAAASGLLAWHYALDGQSLKGLLRLHFLLGWAVLCGVWTTLWLRRTNNASTAFVSTPVLLWELGVSGLVAATAHIGGFLSGVNM